ncbi:hypothetical protein [Jannaschia ovalis]|uniref:Uncharacterized protein n=1 Tax=Jannaschia ovalis TaxID=3038773 RepID=A0ABY8LCX4_9RHOB|nr:hypothetical protein [Jannaschia sp. GRR-S6-38]WGH78135.1 hypothetical protein P8627_14025 [Jannaschia sp. GRR-S6-38]
MTSPRPLTAFALVLSVAAGGAPAQTAEPPYDPTPFLEAMVAYRALAATCEEVLPGSPLADSEEIAEFFDFLELPEPRDRNAAMERIVYRLVRPQAASICTERLQRSALAYGGQAVDYQQSKPAEWPDAPRIKAGPWCASQSCSELTF